MIGRKKFTYTNATDLTEDFRRLRSERLARVCPDNGHCPVCLGAHEDPRTLACQHTFCRTCLQHCINRSPSITEPNRGFHCAVCGYFTKVVDYSIKRAEWAQLVPKDFTKPEIVHVPEDVIDCNDAGTVETTHSSSLIRAPSIEEIDTAPQWCLHWDISAFPRSYLRKHGLNPFKRMKRLYIYTEDPTLFKKHVPHNVTHDDSASPSSEIHQVETLNGDDRYKDNITRSTRRLRMQTEKVEGCERHNATGNMPAADRMTRAERDTDKCGESEIIACTFFNDSILVYDNGYGELQVYDNSMTLCEIVPHTPVFDMAVLASAVYMTSPDERAVHIYDLEAQRFEPTLYLTSPCYGIDCLGSKLAILLSDSQRKVHQVCCLTKTGVFGKTVALDDGNLQFKEPRYLAFCELTRMFFLSDRIAGVVKCFRLDGHLEWERTVLEAGPLAVYNGYLLVCRTFTNSVDMFGAGGQFRCRLEDDRYELYGPQCLAMRSSASQCVIVDDQQLIHRYTVGKAESLQSVHKTRMCLIL